MDELLHQWFTQYDQAESDPAELLSRFVDRLNRCGFDLFRASVWLPTAHPEVWGTQVVWSSAQGCHTYHRDHSITQTATYLDTPGEQIHRDRHTLRWRLNDASTPLPYALLREIQADGGTDYVIIPIATASDQEQAWVTFSTRAVSGFSSRDIAALEGHCQAIAWKIRLAIADSAKRSLLQVYLGNNAADHVLRGQFSRGSGTSIDAVIWLCDLRDFTALSDRLPAEKVVQVLDRYFECVAGPVEESGGEILKFVGDAVLAVFPCADDRPGAAARALNAAQQTLRNLSALPAPETSGPLRMGIALHIGQVLYGNIGGRSRLDFTVIGPAVNEASRVEALCKTLGADLLMTREFVDGLGQPHQVVSLGIHSLRGVSAPREIFRTHRQTL